MEYASSPYGLAVFFSLLYLILSLLIPINIHRLVILRENKNYYSFNKRLKPFIIYILYFTFLILLSWGPLVFTIFFISGFLHIIPSNFIGIMIIIFLFLFPIYCLFLVYPSLALNLPLASIGQKIYFFKMWKASKGYKLTIFLQFYIINIPLIIIAIPSAIFLKDGLFYNIFLSFIGVFSVALTISCLSKTFLLWREKNTN